MSGRTAKRKGKFLSAEDRALWKRVTNSVTPMEDRKSTASRDAFERMLADTRPDTNTRPVKPRSQQTSAPDGGAAPGNAAPSKATSRSAHVQNGTPPRPPAAPSPKPKTKAPSRPAGPVRLDTKTARRIAKGRDEIDARIDLHGLRQGEAEAALRRFIVRCHAQGFRTVLVITGKGVALGTREAARVEPWQMPERERGVLRRSLPSWLSAPDMRALVSGFDDAHARHGGSGACYVRLRQVRKHS